MARQLYARHLYCLAMLFVPSTYNPTTCPQESFPNPQDYQKLIARRIAWAADARGNKLYLRRQNAAQHCNLQRRAYQSTQAGLDREGLVPCGIGWRGDLGEQPTTRGLRCLDLLRPGRCRGHYRLVGTSR